MAWFATPKRGALKVESPASDDRGLTRWVGIIAVLGFAAGVVWPRLLAVKVGPDVPEKSAPRLAATTAPSAAPAASVSGAIAAPSASSAASAALAEDERPSNRQGLRIGDGVVASCKTKKNEKPESCGKLAIDGAAKSRLKDLDRCPAALGLDGKVTLTVGINFEKSEVVVDNVKKKTEVPSSTLKGIVNCAAESLKGIELDKVAHTHPRYTMSYELTFFPPGKSDEPPEDGATEEDKSARATVSWEKALVRDEPKEGKIVMRLPQGTRVKILEQKDDWYKIETAKGQGWVYRQAIGK